MSESRYCTQYVNLLYPDGRIHHIKQQLILLFFNLIFLYKQTPSYVIGYICILVNAYIVCKIKLLNKEKVIKQNTIN